MTEAAVLAFPERQPEGFVTLAEIRRQFGYSERWWRYRLLEQDFPKHRYGGHWRFLRSEVRAYLDERERHAS